MSVEHSNTIIVFDGVCLLCNRWVQFILRHDSRAQFMFTAMQSPTGKRLLMQHGLNPDDPFSLLLVDESGGHVNTDAIIRILMQFGGTWRLMAAFRVVPRLVRDAIYRYVARHRYRWFGRRDSCMVPNADTANRFIQ